VKRLSEITKIAERIYGEKISRATAESWVLRNVLQPSQSFEGKARLFENSELNNLIIYKEGIAMEVNSRKGPALIQAICDIRKDPVRAINTLAKMKSAPYQTDSIEPKSMKILLRYFGENVFPVPTENELKQNTLPSLIATNMRILHKAQELYKKYMFARFYHDDNEIDYLNKSKIIKEYGDPVFWYLQMAADNNLVTQKKEKDETLYPIYDIIFAMFLNYLRKQVVEDIFSYASVFKKIKEKRYPFYVGHGFEENWEPECMDDIFLTALNMLYDHIAMKH